MGATYFIKAVATENGNFTDKVSQQVKVVVVNSKEVLLASGFSLDSKSLKVSYGDIKTNTDAIKLFSSGQAKVLYKKNAVSYKTDYTVELVGGEDYTAIGTHMIRIVAAEGSNFRGTKTVSFKVLPYNIAENKGGRFAFSSADEARYTAKGAKPKVEVFFVDNQNKKVRLVEGVDYTVSYKNNKKVSSSATSNAPTIIIKGKGRFTGTATKKFTIYN